MWVSRALLSLSRSRESARLWGEAGALEGPRPAAGADFFGTFFLFSRDFLLVFKGIRRTCGHAYHALRQPVGAADRALLHN